MSRTSDPKDLPPSTFPGERLGLPVRGSRSVARLGRRIVALLIDWWIAALIVTLAWGALPSGAGVTDAQLAAAMQRQSLFTLVIFVAMQWLGIVAIGGSIGHRIMGLCVVTVRGGWVGLWRPLVRAVLLALVVPAVVWDSDQRGFHDKIAGTVLLRV